MPKNLSASRRYIIIDECLHNRFHLPSSSVMAQHPGVWTIGELADKIAEKLDLRNPPSERTIKEDIRVMRSGEMGYEAPIRNLSRIGYYYADPDFSITQNPLSELDIENLKEVLAILKQFKGFRYFTDVNSIISKIEDTVNISEYSRVLFDTVPDAAGLEFIEPLSAAIRQKNIVSATYQPFDRDVAETLKLHPYVLKEYNNRWFVLAWSEKDHKTWIYALDRIRTIKLLDEEFEPAHPDDIRGYFKNIVGVSLPTGKPVEEVIVRMRKLRANYLLTKPLHPSQEIIQKDNDSVTFRYLLILNQELESKILELGNDATVIAPPGLWERIKAIAGSILENYHIEERKQKMES